MYPADNLQSVGPEISLSDEEYPHTLLGLESASELESPSSMFDQMKTAKTNAVQSKPFEFYESKLCVLDPDVPWSPSIVLRNIISVPLETDYHRLEKLLTMTRYYEQTLTNRLPKANVNTIGIFSKQLHALLDLVEKIQKRANFLQPQETSISDADVLVGKENSSSPMSPFFGLLTWISHKGHKEEPDHSKLFVDIAELEWSLETIQQQEKILNEANIAGVQKLALLTVEQVSAVWAKQQKAIKLLEKEQFYITNLSLLKVLKIATVDQMESVKGQRTRT